MVRSWSRCVPHPTYAETIASRALSMLDAAEQRAEAFLALGGQSSAWWETVRSMAEHGYPPAVEFVRAAQGRREAQA